MVRCLLEVIGMNDPGWNDQPSFHLLPLLGCHNLHRTHVGFSTMSALQACNNKLDKPVSLWQVILGNQTRALRC